MDVDIEFVMKQLQQVVDNPAVSDWKVGYLIELCRVASKALQEARGKPATKPTADSTSPECPACLAGREHDGPCESASYVPAQRQVAALESIAQSLESAAKSLESLDGRVFQIVDRWGDR